jgi:hypothetical protein
MRGLYVTEVSTTFPRMLVIASRGVVDEELACRWFCSAVVNFCMERGRVEV